MSTIPAAIAPTITPIWFEIGKQRLGAPAATVTFSGISTDYRMLWLIGQVIKATSGVVNLSINGDSGTNYDKQYLFGNNTAVTGARSTGQTSIQLAGGTAIPDAQAGLYSVIISKQQTGNKALATAGCAIFADLATDAIVVDMDAGIWSNTSNLMSSVALTASAGNFAADSIFVLMGSQGDS